MSAILIAGLWGNGPGTDAPAGGENAGNGRPPVYELGEKSAFIRIDSPRPGDKLRSPLVVTGAARTWYFEGSFPVELKDANGITIATGIAQAQGDWMSDEMVPFSSSLSFLPPATAVGTLILKKDNPSGLPQYDDEVQVQVEFGN